MCEGLLSGLHQWASPDEHPVGGGGGPVAHASAHLIAPEQWATPPSLSFTLGFSLSFSLSLGHYAAGWLPNRGPYFSSMEEQQSLVWIPEQETHSALCFLHSALCTQHCIV